MGDNAISPWDDDEAAALLRKDTGRSTPGFEPDPSLDPYGDKPDWQRGLLHARDEDLAANDYVPPAERMAQGVATMAMTPAAGGGWLSALAKQAAAGGFTSGLARYRDTGDTDQAIEAGEHGAGLAALLGAGGRALGSMFGGASKALGGAANAARAKAYGLSAEELAANAKEAGTSVPEATDDLVRAGERLAPPNRVFPIGAGSYSQRFGAAADEANAGIEGAIDDATRGGARVPSDARGQVVRGLDEAADSAMGAGRADQTKLAAALRGEADAAARGPQYSTPQELRAQKIALDRTAFQGEPGSPESYAGQAAKTAADQYRGMLADYVGEGAPEAVPAYEQALSDYGTAATLRDSSAALAARQAAGGGALPRMIGPAIGGAAGYAMGGIPGMSAGAAFGYAARNAPQNLGADFAANLARGGENVTGMISSATNWLGQQAPTASQLAIDMQGPRPSTASPHDQQQAAMNSRGHELPGKIARALQTAPQVLGPYAQQLSAAVDDPEELDAMIERLRRTDPRFETTIVPRFQQ